MFYIINKEKGISSFKAINQFAKKNKILKIGHSGTLDPLASGLLLCCSDDDLKLLNYINNKSKKYKVTLILGFKTDSYDITGKIIETSNNVVKDDYKIKKFFDNLIGKSLQIPPVFSAKKINGQKSYDLARKGEFVEIKPVEITTYSYEILYLDLHKQELCFNIHVSNGTYIRSIVNDLGNYLNTFATMSELDRYEISSLLFNEDLSYQNILPKLFQNLIKISKNDVIEIQMNHFNYIIKTDWFNRIVSNNGQYILIDQCSFLPYGIIEISQKKLKIVKLFGKRLI
ncbi:tRNA pseudouridine(55) synthase TruB [Mycoplasma phocimorsus]|uniref:tRNA pseudouridine(55) synthase TruB n=1 Tax=Mycoplasma phocimorsus TaxID=3045839 RepID=UPI0024C01EC0|nr:tRNA pseudouridine(55) synthase TruB [Mycoplasma phocimorsus]MDJ1647023.1 tRNA pseudouridine(55) synthase TruB [Mycoplasma phocimorsus]